MPAPSAPRTLLAQAPTRIDLAGGTLDLWPLYLFIEGSRTVNAAIDVFSSVRLEPTPAGYEIVSRDQGRGVRAAALKDLEPAGELPLVARLLRHFAPAPGLRVVTEGRSPAGAGLGGSSSLAVALAGALAEWTGRRLDGGALIALVANLEAQVLRTPTGTQDHWAALEGGLSVLHLGPAGVRRQALADASDWLGPRLVLCYTGAPHHSGISNWEVYKRAIDREPETCRALEEIASAAAAMEAALEARDAERVAEVLDREWRARQRLAPGVSTPRIDEIDRWGREHGALAGKVCGAGGGGCLLFIAAEARAGDLAAGLRTRGVEVLPCRLAARGLDVRWT